MNDWHPALLSHWYAVALASEIGHRPIAVSLFDTHIALARGGDGWFAVEDRCPHRQVPLSAGCVEGGHLRCPYHGWSFDTQGRLQSIPGLDENASLPDIGVRTFAVRELDGFIWIRPGKEGEAEPNTLVREVNPATRRFQWRTCWQAHVIDAMENFLDPLHTHFVHAGLVRRDGKRVAASATLTTTREGFTVDYRGGPAQSGILYRLFESPRTHERAHFAVPGSTRLEYIYANGSRVLIDLHFTPHGSHETDVFVALHVEGRWAPSWAVRLLLWPWLKRVNNQDAAMLRLQNENKRRFKPTRGVSTPLDIVRDELLRFWSGEGLSPLGEQRRIDLML